jgi:hypothetical protein
VVYDHANQLKRGEVTELPSQAWFYSVLPREVAQAICCAFGIWVDRGDLDLDEEMSLSKKLPEIKTMKLKKLFEKAWKN